LDSESRKLDAEDCPSFNVGTTGYRTAMLSRNIGGDGKSQSGSIVSGGKERVEDSVFVFSSDTASLIGYFNAQSILKKEAMYAYDAFAVCRLNRIQNQVQENLLDLFGVAVNLPALGFVGAFNGDALPACDVLCERGDRSDQFARRDTLQTRQPRTCKI